MQCKKFKIRTMLQMQNQCIMRWS